MIKEIRLKRWKSFGEATLYIDPLTVLIGANASGKSNALDSLRFLQRLASGKDLTTALAGEYGQPGIRGGLEWAALKPHDSFEITVLIQSSTEGVDYQYSIEAGTKGTCELLSESLIMIKDPPGAKKGEPYRNPLFKTEPVGQDQSEITVKLSATNKKQGGRKNFSRSLSILSQLQPANFFLRKEIAEGIDFVTKSLRSIFVLDPIPVHMGQVS